MHQQDRERSFLPTMLRALGAPDIPVEPSGNSHSSRRLRHSACLELMAEHWNTQKAFPAWDTAELEEKVGEDTNGSREADGRCGGKSGRKERNGGRECHHLIEMNRHPFFVFGKRRVGLLETTRKAARDRRTELSSNCAIGARRTENWLEVVGGELTVATRRREPLAGEPCGIVGGQEHGDAGDVVRLSEATQRTCWGRLARTRPRR
jgi:hypothetical protein